MIVHKTSIWIIEEGWTKEWLNMVSTILKDEWMNKCILCPLVYWRDEWMYMVSTIRKNEWMHECIWCPLFYWMKGWMNVYGVHYSIEWMNEWMYMVYTSLVNVGSVTSKQLGILLDK